MQHPTTQNDSNNHVMIDEGIMDVLQQIFPVLDPVAKARKHGVKEVHSLAKNALAKFSQYIGRQQKDFNDVTWNMLFKYMTMPNQLKLTPEEAKKIISDPTTVQQIKASLTKSKLPLPAANTWGKPNSPISGDPQNPKAKLAGQLITAEILGLGAIKYLEKESAGQDLNTTQQAAVGSAQQQAPQAAAVPPAAAKLVNNQLTQILQKLGGTP